MDYEWDPIKADINYRKHGIHFADAIAIFDDEEALWQEDRRNYDETRFIAIGMDHLMRILIVVFTFRDETIRIISARQATKQEQKTYENRRY